MRADAHVLHDAGEEATARKELKKSKDLRQSNHEEIALAETKLSELHFDLDDAVEMTPVSRLKDLLDVFHAKKQAEDEVTVQLAWTRSLLSQGQTAEAERHFASAEATATLSHDVNLKPDLLLVRA